VKTAGGGGVPPLDPVGSGDENDAPRRCEPDDESGGPWPVRWQVKRLSSRRAGEAPRDRQISVPQCLGRDDLLRASEPRTEPPDVVGHDVQSEPHSVRPEAP